MLRKIKTLLREYRYFKRRLKIAFKLLFSGEFGYVVFVDSKDVVDIVQDGEMDEKEIQLVPFGLTNYLVLSITKQLGDSVSDVELITERALFQVDFDEFKEKKNLVD